MIFGSLPTSITVGGVEYPIKTDFRDWIEFEKQLTAYSDSDVEKANQIISAVMYVMDVIPEDIQSALNEILNFYSCSDDWKNVKKPTSNGKTPIFDYYFDSPYIYAAFVEKYNIDLTETDMHWWKFRALMKSLTECKLSEIISYRSMKIDNKLPRSQKEFYTEMKRIYAIPLDKELLDRDKELIEALRNGEDITKFL